MYLGALLLAACGDPPPDVAVYASGSTGFKLNAQICKPGTTTCGVPAVLLDGDHQTGQGGIYNLTAGAMFPLAFSSDNTMIPPPLRCRQVPVIFHAAQQVITVSVAADGIAISCDAPANCGAPGPCGP